MLNYFNFSIFLITLGIISVTHAGPYDFDEIDFLQPGRGQTKSVGSGNSLLKSSLNENEIGQLLSTIDTALSKLKEIVRKQQKNREANMDEIPENESSSSSPYNTKQSSKPNSLKSPSRNGMSPQKRPLESNGMKLIGTNGSKSSYLVMPEENPPEHHDHEAPEGFTEDEAHIIRLEVLKRTNHYRRQHDCDILKLNEDMNNHAQEWANVLAKDSVLRHRSQSDNSIYGENLYASSVLEKLGETGVDYWYNELRNVRVTDGENELVNGPRGVVGHLTQVLWKKSKELGVGVAKRYDGMYILVANYNPRGNVIGFFEDNVPTFTKDDIQAADDAHAALEKKKNTPKVSYQRFSSGPISSSSGLSSPFENSQLMSSLMGSSAFGNSPFGSSLFGNSPFGNSMQRGGSSFRRLQ